MATQKDITQFLDNTENAQKLNDLVEDIREAVMDYQVRTLRGLLSFNLMFALDFVTAGHLQQHPSPHCTLLAPSIRPFVVICNRTERTLPFSTVFIMLLMLDTSAKADRGV